MSSSDHATFSAAGPCRYIDGQGSNSQAFTYAGSGKLSADPGLIRRVYPIGKSLAVTLIFIGSHLDGATSADNFTYDYRVFWIHRLMKADRFPENYLSLMTYAGGGSITLGTQVGDAGKIVTDKEHFADTLTWTSSGIGTAPAGPQVLAETAYNEGASTGYSATAADNRHSFLFLPVCLRATGILIDFDATGGGAANTFGNALIMNDEV